VSENGWKRGPSAIKLVIEHYNGWLIKLLTGQEKIFKERFFTNDITELLKGTNSVRLQLSLQWTTPPVTDNRAEMVAGIMGFRVAPEHVQWGALLPTASHVGLEIGTRFTVPRGPIIIWRGAGCCKDGG
jgi:hypothetical protein